VRNNTFRLTVVTSLCNRLSSSAVRFDRKRLFCVFDPYFGGLAATYDVHVRFIGLSISVNLTFLQGVTAEAIRARIDRKSAGWSVFAKFSRRRIRYEPIIFVRIVRPMNALQHCR